MEAAQGTYSGRFVRQFVKPEMRVVNLIADEYAFNSQMLRQFVKVVHQGQFCVKRVTKHPLGPTSHTAGIAAHEDTHHTLQHRAIIYDRDRTLTTTSARKHCLGAVVWAGPQRDVLSPVGTQANQ